MATKREVLLLLTRDELLVALDRYEIQVGDRRLRNDLVEALGGSRRASLSDIRGDLSRDRLKEMCRALGLDDSGREKASIADRLTGEKGRGSDPKQTEPVSPPETRTPMRRSVLEGDRGRRALH